MKRILVRFNLNLSNLFRPSARTLIVGDVGYSIGAGFVTLYGKDVEYVFPVSAVKFIKVSY